MQGTIGTGVPIRRPPVRQIATSPHVRPRMFNAKTIGTFQQQASTAPAMAREVGRRHTRGQSSLSSVRYNDAGGPKR